MAQLSTIRSGSSTLSGDKRKSHKSFFGAVKDLFSAKEQDRKLAQRRLSILSTGSSEAKKEQEEEEKRAAYRERCVAIRQAKSDPPEVQALLVDCERCNPPPPYGRDVEINTPQWTSADRTPPEVVRKEAETEPESVWNRGLHEWIAINQWWNTRTEYAVPEHHDLEGVNPDKYFAIYDKFVRFERPPKRPLNLDDMVKLLKAGWIGDRTWPTKIDPEDVWSDEEIDNPSKLEKSQSPPPNSREGTPASGGAKVMFDTMPHPPRTGNPHHEFKPIERTMSQASTGRLSLQPTRSTGSSIISITTDED